MIPYKCPFCGRVFDISLSASQAHRKGHMDAAKEVEKRNHQAMTLEQKQQKAAEVALVRARNQRTREAIQAYRANRAQQQGE